MFLIAAQKGFAISLEGTQPEFLECRSCNLELPFKSKTFNTDSEKCSLM